MEGKLHVAEREMFESVNTPSVVIHFLVVKTAPTEASSKISRDAKWSLQRASANITTGNDTCYLLGLSDHKEELENLHQNMQLSHAWPIGTLFFRQAFTRGPGTGYRVLGLQWGGEEVPGAGHKHAKSFTVQSP